MSRRRLIVRPTAFRLSGEHEERPVQELYRHLIRDPLRNGMIAGDAAMALAQRRRCIVYTHWRKHIPLLMHGFRRWNLRLRRMDRSVSAPWNESRDVIVLAHGDLDRLKLLSGVDTLLLAFPVSLKKAFLEALKRLLAASRNRDFIVCDYVDVGERILARLFHRRWKRYRALGFRSEGPALPRALQSFGRLPRRSV